MPLDSFEKIVSSTALDSNDTDVSKENGISFFFLVEIVNSEIRRIKKQMPSFSGSQGSSKRTGKTTGATLLPHTVPNIADVSKINK